MWRDLGKRRVRDVWAINLEDRNLEVRLITQGLFKTFCTINLDGNEIFSSEKETWLSQGHYDFIYDISENSCFRVSLGQHSLTFKFRCHVYHNSRLIGGDIKKRLVRLSLMEIMLFGFCISLSLFFIVGRVIAILF